MPSWHIGELFTNKGKMISSLRGKLIYKKPECIIVDVNGVGYEVTIPFSVLSELPDEGREVFLLIYTHVKEDALQLYGFLRDEEKKVFTTVLGVSGIGPKIALSILSSISTEDFLDAINNENITKLTRIPGLGRKTAQRLILELREKLPKDLSAKESAYDDALSALLNLGYKKSDAANALDVTYKKGIKDIETLLKESLKYLNAAN